MPKEIATTSEAHELPDLLEGRLTTADSIDVALRSLRITMAELGHEENRPSVSTTIARMEGLHDGLVLMREAARQDDDLRDAMARALDALAGPNAATHRIDEAARILRRAAGL